MTPAAAPLNPLPLVPPMTPMPSPSTEAAPTTCARCGVFLHTRDELRFLLGKPYCSACVVRTDVDYLEAFRLKYWGKRDSWAWLVGVGTPFSALVLAGSVAGGLWSSIPAQVASLVFGLAFFFRQRWARWGMYVAFGLSLVPLIGTAQLPIVAGSTLFSMLIWTAIISSTLNKLFFKLDVSRADLQKAWDLFANNTLARAGFLLGLFSLIAWPLGAVALPLSLVGYTRVDPTASPPIGRKGQAIAGIVCSSLSLLALAAVIVASVMKP